MSFGHRQRRVVPKGTFREKPCTALVPSAGLLGASLLSAGLLGTAPLPAQVLLGVEAAATRAGDARPLPDAPHAVGPSHPLFSTDRSEAGDVPIARSGASVPSLTFHERERHFFLDLVGPPAFIAPAFESGIDTARPLKVGYPSDGFFGPGQHPAHGSVPEWGEGAQGYAKRYADRFGQGLIGTTSRYALGEVLREDVSYHRCQCTGLLPRTSHALIGAYLAQTRGGHTMPSMPALASPFVASEVAVAAWYPGRYNTSDALRTSLLNYVAAPFKNLYSEFLPK